MTTTERIWRVAQGMGNSFTFDDGLAWPDRPRLTVPRSIVVLSSLTVGFTLMAVYGDTVVAGRPGRFIALAGLVGVVVVLPTLLSDCLRRGRRGSVPTPDWETYLYRR